MDMAGDLLLTFCNATAENFRCDPEVQTVTLGVHILTQLEPASGNKLTFNLGLVINMLQFSHCSN